MNITRVSAYKNDNFLAEVAKFLPGILNEVDRNTKFLASAIMEIQQRELYYLDSIRIEAIYHKPWQWKEPYLTLPLPIKTVTINALEDDKLLDITKYGFLDQEAGKLDLDLRLTGPVKIVAEVGFKALNPAAPAPAEVEGKFIDLLTSAYAQFLQEVKEARIGG